MEVKTLVGMAFWLLLVQFLTQCQGNAPRNRRSIQAKSSDAEVKSEDNSNFVSFNIHLEIADKDLQFRPNSLTYSLHYLDYEKTGNIEFTDFLADIPLGRFPVDQKNDLKVEILENDTVKLLALKRDFSATLDTGEIYLLLKEPDAGDDDNTQEQEPPAGDPVKDLFLTIPDNWVKYQDAYNIDTTIIGLIPPNDGKYADLANIDGLDEPYLTFYVREQTMLNMKQIFVNDAKVEKDIVEKKIGSYTWKILETSKNGYFMTSFLLVYKGSTYYGYCRSKTAALSSQIVDKFLENIH